MFRHKPPSNFWPIRSRQFAPPIYAQCGDPSNLYRITNEMGRAVVRGALPQKGAKQLCYTLAALSSHVDWSRRESEWLAGRLRWGLRDAIALAEAEKAARVFGGAPVPRDIEREAACWVRLKAEPHHERF